MRWILVFFTLIGNYLNIKKQVSGFFIFLAVDSFYCYEHILKSEYDEAALFFVYAICAIYGAYSWLRK